MLDLDLREASPPRRFKRGEYERLVELGMFDNERVELIHGVIVTMAPNHPPHASPVQLLNEILVTQLRRRASVRPQLPIIAADDSMPEPDLAIVAVESYAKRHPDQAFLVIEVAHTSQRHDRRVKAPLYAASGFREYWIVDVAARLVEVHRGASVTGWASITRHHPGEVLALAEFPDVTVAIDDFLP